MTIVLVGKYTRLEDAYASVIKALQHASLAVNHRLDLKVNFGKSEQASNEQICSKYQRNCLRHKGK